MLNCEEVSVTRKEVVSITCDRCGKTFDDMMDMQEFHRVKFTGGYSSVFGDMTKVECDLCQDCLKDLIGDYCRTTDEVEENEVW